MSHQGVKNDRLANCARNAPNAPSYPSQFKTPTTALQTVNSNRPIIARFFVRRFRIIVRFSTRNGPEMAHKWLKWLIFLITLHGRLGNPSSGHRSRGPRRHQVGTKSEPSRDRDTPQDTPQVNPQVWPPVTGQPESWPEWFNKGAWENGAGDFQPPAKPHGWNTGGRTFLSANKKFMAGWKTRPPFSMRMVRLTRGSIGCPTGSRVRSGCL